MNRFKFFGLFWQLMPRYPNLIGLFRFLLSVFYVIIIKFVLVIY